MIRIRRLIAAIGRLTEAPCLVLRCRAMSLAATTYPLLFTLQVPVEVGDFVVGVEMRGGAVVTVEDDDGTEVYLAHGLQPGGISGTGGTLQDAYGDLRRGIELVLDDIADESPNFRAFKRDVEEFFADTDRWAEETFESARREVAAGKVQSDLPRVANPKFRCDVVKFHQPLSELAPEPDAMWLAAA